MKREGRGKKSGVVTFHFSSRDEKTGDLHNLVQKERKSEKERIQIYTYIHTSIHIIYAFLTYTENSQ